MGKSLGTRLISTMHVRLGPLSKDTLESVQNSALQACIYVVWQIITIAKLHSYQCISIMHAAHAYVMGRNFQATECTVAEFCTAI